MGRLTPEKINQILKTYRKNKSYGKTAKIEEVNERTVAKHVREQSAVEAANQLKASSQDLPEGELSPKAKDTTAAPPSLALQNPLTSKNTPFIQAQSIESKVFKFYHDGGNPIQAVMKLNISSEQAEKIYRRFVELKVYDDASEQLGNLDGDTIRNIMRLDRHMRGRNLDASTYISRLQQFDVFLNGQNEIAQVNAELKERREQLRQVRESIASFNKQMGDMELDLRLKQGVKAKSDMELSRVIAMKDAMMRDIRVLNNEQLMPAIRNEGKRMLQDYEYVLKGAINASMEALLDSKDLGIMISLYNSLKNGMVSPQRVEKVRQEILDRIKQHVEKAMDTIIIDLLGSSIQRKTGLDIFNRRQ